MYKKIILFSILLVSILMTMLTVTGCGELKGDPTANVKPIVSFVTVPVDSSLFQYAPVVYWIGSDPDGFVEFYSFADITDQSAINAPTDFIDQIPEEAWRDTISHSATIKFLSEVGDTTEHIFYIRCTDNEGKESSVKYRTFFRTNNAPNIPRIGVMGTTETDWATRYPNPAASEEASTIDTFYTAPNVNGTYPGIQFSWRSNDPDDRIGSPIPLEYQAVLIKSPSDTVFKRNWSDEIDITLIDLETGFYTLNVWCHDDGLTLSDAPARAEFNVIKPTFENNLLMVIEAAGGTEVLGSWPMADTLDAFYPKLLNDVADDLRNVSLDLADTNDVKIVHLHDLSESRLSLSLVSKYKLVIFIADQLSQSPDPSSSTYITDRRSILDPYLRVGGRTWFMGRHIRTTMADFPVGDDNTDPNVIFMRQFFDVGDIISSGYVHLTDIKVPAEMIGTQRALTGLTNNLTFDAAKAEQNFGPSTPNFGGYLDPDTTIDWGQSAVDYFQRNANSQTTQYFKSNTVGRSDLIEDEDSEVIDDTSNGLYPPTSTMCFLQTNNPLVRQVLSITNVTRDVVGELVSTNNNILKVSYEQMMPWHDDDVLEVTYIYNAISDYSLRPCEIRYESIYASGLFGAFFQLNYRTAITSFSYYLMEEEDVREAWAVMLDWFYYPTVHP